MEKERTMLYGKRYKICNFSVLKFNKPLRNSEKKALVARIDIPKEEYWKIRTGQVSFIKVSSDNGLWSVEFCCNTAAYKMIDIALGSGNDKPIEGLGNIFNMWFMDTNIIGDEEYQSAKASAIRSFMDRIDKKEEHSNIEEK